MKVKLAKTKEGLTGTNKTQNSLGHLHLPYLAVDPPYWLGADIGLMGVSFEFSLALIGMAYGIGPVSGCHINPAVSLGMVAAGRMTMP